MTRVTCIDLAHLGLEGAIASYLLDGPEPALVDPGPATTFERLRDELARLGVGPTDLRHVLLTHVHLDHAGASGHLAEAFPRALVRVHEDGAPHMADPERLVASTRRTFGEAHDRLWGETRAVPKDRIRAWTPGATPPLAGIRPIATPGHIAHHLAYLDETTGTLLSGDAMGIVLGSDVPSFPPTPPPSVDPRAWAGTLNEIGGVGPERFGAAHFGVHGDVPGRIAALRSRLERLESRVREALEGGNEADAERYEEEVRDELTAGPDGERIGRYFDTFPPATDWAGMAFWVKRNP